MSERFAQPPPPAWSKLADGEADEAWTRFERRFGFHASTTPEGWPAVAEPTPSVTFDLSRIEDGPQRGAAYDAVNAEALRAFVCALPDIHELLVLDWHHPTYRLRPAFLALSWKPDWAVPVYPDGDYSAFLLPDFSGGTFGHPWEQTLCVFGDRLVNSLGSTLGTWLPAKRFNGANIDD